jgi:hypothetical protein
MYFNLEEGDCRSFIHFEKNKNGWRAITYVKNRMAEITGHHETTKTVKIGLQPEITVILSALAEVDVSKQFICFDELEDGTWSLCVTKKILDECF